MSVHLPPKDSPLRDLFDMDTLVKLADANSKLPVPLASECRVAGRKFLAKENFAVAVNSICQSNGKLALMEFGRDSERILWIFSNDRA